MQEGWDERNSIDVETFMRNLERHIDDLPPTLHADTRLLDLPNWTSLQALIVVASFSWDYGVTISDEEFRRAQTIEDLYSMVVQRMPR